MNTQQTVPLDAGTIPDVVHFLLRDEDTFNLIKNDHPEILADLTTLKTNPNCSCRGKVAKYFHDKLGSNPNILDKYYKDKSAIIKELDIIKAKRLENVIGGKIYKVALGDEAWKEFNKIITGKVFRSFSVVREYDYLWVYFL